MKKIVLLIIFILVFVAVKAQETLPVSGGDAAGSGGAISYTIGQLVYTNPTTMLGSLNQGIQQNIEFVTLVILN